MNKENQKHLPALDYWCGLLCLYRAGLFVFSFEKCITVVKCGNNLIAVYSSLNLEQIILFLRCLHSMKLEHFKYHMEY